MPLPRAATGTGTFPDVADYRDILSRFPRYADRGWHPDPLGDPLVGYFGGRGSEEDAIRSLGNYAFTSSLLASRDPDDGLMLGRARASLRYLTRGHRTGEEACANGSKWGHAWQSAWWTTKMALGARLIWGRLSPEERAAVERVVVSEASVHLDRVVPSGLHLDTKAEENAWDAEVLAVAVGLLPGHPDASRWWEKFVEFASNTLSVPQDRESDARLDGRKVRDRVYTANLHGDFTLENHGAYHFCYVASPLASICWSYLALSLSGLEPPEALFHHVRDLWYRVKGTFLEDRFAHIGGQDWARYTYGQYFIVPALVLIQYRFGDPDARGVEAARVRALALEQSDNDDGSFFGRRVTRGVMQGQEAKYETDCYANLGLALLLHETLGPPSDAPGPEALARSLSTRHVSPESATCFVRTPSLFASFSWATMTHPVPTALFVPAGMDSAFEAGPGNLLGRAVVRERLDALTIRGMKPLGDGFDVAGTILYTTSRGFVLEHRLRYTVIPEEDRAVIESTLVARSRIVVLRCNPLNFCVCNDFFNGFGREYRWDGGSHRVAFDPSLPDPLARRGRTGRMARKVLRAIGRGNTRIVMGRKWANVDDKLGVIRLGGPGPRFQLECPHGRNIDGSLHGDILSIQGRSIRPRVFRTGDVLFDSRVLLLVGTAEQTEALANRPEPDRSGDIRPA